MTNRPSMPKRGGSWTRVAIFISLYVLLLESLIEWVLVLYLYGNKRVDMKMTPALILVLVASFLTVPLVFLHSLLAWQYHKISGFAGQKKILFTICTYILRGTIIVWLAASVAGLVVVAQQAPCLPDGTGSGLWKVGVSCAIYRASVIVSVISFVTICIYFCSKELCDHPYDVSLLGVYNQRGACDDSIFSHSSWESENSLKNDVLYVCRRPDATYDHRGLYWASSNDTVVEKPGDNLSIQHPTPIHPRPQLRINTSSASEHSEMMPPGSTVSPSDTLARASSAATDFYPISRTTTMTSRTPIDANFQVPFIAELPVPDVPPIPAKFTHKRAKSSLSSLRKFLPKAFPLSLPLSADPQIRALADPVNHPDLEKQVEKVINNPRNDVPTQASRKESHTRSSPPPETSENAAPKNTSPTQSKTTKESPSRSATVNFADAPEVVPPGPLKVRKPSAAEMVASFPRPFHYPHHTSHIATSQPQIVHPPTRRPSHSTQPDRVRRNSTRLYSTGNRRNSNQYQFEQSQIPRHSQTQYHPHPHYARFEPQRKMTSPFPRRNDVEIIYSSTRRPRSSTYGLGSSFSGHLDSILESRASVDEAQSVHHSHVDGGDLINDTTYRGANRTSMPAF